jgi:hypothetical protein
MKFLAICTVTIPKYGLGTSRHFGTIRGNLKLPLIALNKDEALEKVQNALRSNRILKKEIHNIDIVEESLDSISQNSETVNSL